MLSLFLVSKRLFSRSMFGVAGEVSLQKITRNLQGFPLPASIQNTFLFTLHCDSRGRRKPIGFVLVNEALRSFVIQR